MLLKGEMTHRVPIGTSAAGNIQRLDNALAGIPARLEKAEQQLDNLRRDVYKRQLLPWLDN